MLDRFPALAHFLRVLVEPRLNVFKKMFVLPAGNAALLGRGALIPDGAGLRAVTTGGVVEPGVPLMEIVPADDPLIVEARVKPADIDVARPDRPVRLPFDRAPSHRFR